jgi:hypothetical protein
MAFDGHMNGFGDFLFHHDPSRRRVFRRLFSVSGWDRFSKTAVEARRQGIQTTCLPRWGVLCGPLRRTQMTLWIYSKWSSSRKGQNWTCLSVHPVGCCLLPCCHVFTSTPFLNRWSSCGPRDRSPYKNSKKGSLFRPCFSEVHGLGGCSHLLNFSEPWMAQCSQFYTSARRKTLVLDVEFAMRIWICDLAVFLTLETPIADFFFRRLEHSEMKTLRFDLAQGGQTLSRWPPFRNINFVVILKLSLDALKKTWELSLDGTSKSTWTSQNEDQKPQTSLAAARQACPIPSWWQGLAKSITPKTRPGIEWNGYCHVI